MKLRELTLFATACAIAAVPSLFAHAAGGTGTSTRTYPAGRPPWFRGSVPPAVGNMATFPVRLAPAPDGTPDAGLPRAALERLADELTIELAGVPGVRVLESEHPGPADQGPSVRLGCVRNAEEAAGECDPGRRERS